MRARLNGSVLFVGVLASLGCRGCFRREVPVENQGSTTLPITTVVGADGVARAAASVTVDCKAKTKAISPDIYGIGFDITGYSNWKDPRQWDMRPSGRRLGGNAVSRYNWEHGTAFNHGVDWIFANNGLGPDAEPFWITFMAENEEHNVTSAIEIVTLGWVAKDTTSNSFPIDQYGPQQTFDATRNAGNGKKRDGTEIAPPAPTTTSIKSTPEFQQRWVKAIVEKAKARKWKGKRVYMLDNEPALWNSTHRDVHPEPTTYDELLALTKAYAPLIRKADPDALIAGPCAWGWPEYFFSAKDAKIGFRIKPDRRAHEDMPHLAWYLRELAAHEKKTGEKLIDILDVHYYPQSDGIGVGTKGEVDPKTVATRMRSPRALWDPTYKDESWIDEPVRLIPRLREWIDQYYPGVKIQIGEWNFGAEGDMSSGIATAEAFGRFADEGVFGAYYWPFPKIDSPAYFAFRAFRNFDGKGARFLDALVPTKTASPLSVWTSKDETGKHMVAIVLNMSTDHAASSTIAFDGCGTIEKNETYVFTTGSKDFTKSKLDAKDNVLSGVIPPYSISVLDVRLK